MSRISKGKPASSRVPLRLSPDLTNSAGPRIWTPDEVRKAFGPAHSLGATDDIRMAMDSQLDSDGVYTLLQHSLQMGQGEFPQFMGYGALQNIAQNGLIRACVETVADDMTRAWISLKGGNENKADDEFIQKMDEAQRKAGLQPKFHEAAELVGYEGGAFIFIDTGASGADLETPLHIGDYGAEISRGSFLRFTVIDPVNVFPGDYNSMSPLKSNYFRPDSWWVLGQKVHASRLIRLVANETPILLRPAYNFLGIPQAQILWDYVLHFQQCRAAEARLLTKFSLIVFKTNMSEIFFQAGGTNEIDSRIRYMIQNMSNDGILAIDREEDVLKLETPLSGVTDIVKQALEFLAALNRTPAVKLLGISPSGFNATGESDIRNYYDHIRSQQEKIFRAGIEKALKCLQLQAFGALENGVDFDFEPLGEEDRAAIAAQQKTKADTIAVYLDRGVISPEEARKAMAQDPASGFAFIDPGVMPDDEPDPELDDADKAGAVYDALFGMDGDEDDGWITTENEKKIHLKDGEIDKGNVGQSDGPAYERAKAIQEKIDSIRIDPDRDNILPNLNPETLEEIGKTDKPVLLKKNIIDRNELKHSDISLEEAQSLIGEALYKPLKVLKGNAEKDYMNFIGLDKDKHCVVLLDVTENLDNFEIVHWHRINLYGLNKLGRKDRKIRAGIDMEGQA